VVAQAQTAIAWKTTKDIIVKGYVKEVLIESASKDSWDSEVYEFCPNGVRI
jgi:hypothetical protein